jgi:hypothetical protein
MVAQTSTQRATPDDPFSSDDSFITIRSFGIETFATGGAYLNPAYVSSGIQFIPALTKLNGVIDFDRSSWKRFWFNCKVHIGNDMGEFLAQKKLCSKLSNHWAVARTIRGMSKNKPDTPALFLDEFEEFPIQLKCGVP